ncbi:PXA domain-containing protein [Daldinia decipiens]|uniref:PXA domain-containing protein n=1 Tax=Daldinia decipiens TaxID=326647 RepID=UPI0020C53BD7|nr:PXA domain-containing protein [Daldinia decipiens]KAI1661710.1 PXA domain-containing protein [Daldinia decipiens]
MTAAPSGTVPPKGGGPVPTSLKAPATSSTNPESVTSTGSKPSSSPHTTPPTSVPRRSPRPVSSDFLSDKATATFIRRVLCAQHLADRGRSTPAPIQDLLPPLTSRNDVDLQLYALIAIIIKEFVQNWYTKITPDETFVAEIVQIIAHCTRALEQRLRNVDLESLLFDELPELLDAHIRAYRVARNTVARPPVEANPREIYHSLWPLPALSPVPKSGHSSIQTQEDNESAYRQLLVQGVLALLLPTEDLENECLTTLVEQLFSELVIGNLIINKLSEPWLIWEGLIILTRIVRARSTIEASGPGDMEPDANLKTIRGIVPPITRKRSLYIQQFFWTVIQWGFVIVNSIRLMISTIMLSRTLPPRSIPTIRQVDPTSHDYGEKSYHPPTSEVGLQPVNVPIADFKLWACVGNLLEIDARMPWMSGTLSMAQWGALRGPGNLAGFNGMIDRLFSHYIHVYILDPVRLPPLLRAVRGAVFPNNAPGSSSLIPPSSDEQLGALRRRCASALLALVPKRVGRLYYGSSIWPWSTRSTSTLSSASSRSGPFKADSYNTTHNANRTGEEVARVRLTDDGKSVRDNHATLTPDKSKRQIGDTGVRPTEAGGDKRADMCNGDEDEDEDENRILSEIETGVLDVFSDPYCNKHLLYGILELILVRLMPELTEKGVIELWEDRLS